MNQLANASARVHDPNARIGSTAAQSQPNLGFHEHAIHRAAELMMLDAAGKYDRGEPCGAEANAAKYLAAEAGFRACETAIMTHGGFGYAREYHVERYFREIQIARLAPVSPQLILCYIAEKVLGLPKSY